MIIINLKDAEDKALGSLIHQALLPSVRLELFPKSTIDIFITIIECDGAENCFAASTTVVSTALAHAGIELMGLVVSCSAVNHSDYFKCSMLSQPVRSSKRPDLVRRDWRGGNKRQGLSHVSLHASFRSDYGYLANWPVDTRASGEGRFICPLTLYDGHFNFHIVHGTLQSSMSRCPCHCRSDSSRFCQAVA